MNCFIIAEAGVNHNGSTGLALKLIEAAAKAGADAIKFQTFRAQTLVSPDASAAEYQYQNTGHASQFEMLRALEMSAEMHYAIVKHCEELNIEFMSTAFDIASVDFLLELGVKRFKLPSGEITNIPLLEYLASQNLPIIISTGMASLNEVEDAVNLVREVRSRLGFLASLENNVTLLHCTSNYPTRFQDVNLRAMQTMAQHCKLPVGYSDHTDGILIAPIAVALGATVIEKHFTLDRSMPGPDHKASLEPEALTQMIRNIRDTEFSLGHGEKIPAENEIAVRDVARRSVTLRQAKTKGSVLTLSDLALLRPGIGIQPKEMNQIVGRILKQDLSSGTTLHWHHLEP